MKRKSFKLQFEKMLKDLTEGLLIDDWDKNNSPAPSKVCLEKAIEFYNVLDESVCGYHDVGPCVGGGIAFSILSINGPREIYVEIDNNGEISGMLINDRKEFTGDEHISFETNSLLTIKEKIIIFLK